MESGPSNSSNNNITYITFDSRALCAICGASAIGNKKFFVNFCFSIILFSYMKDEISMHTRVYHVKVMSKIFLKGKINKYIF